MQGRRAVDVREIAHALVDEVEEVVDGRRAHQLAVEPLGLLERQRRAKSALTSGGHAREAAARVRLRLRRTAAACGGHRRPRVAAGVVLALPQCGVMLLGRHRVRHRRPAA